MNRLRLLAAPIRRVLLAGLPAAAFVAAGAAALAVPAARAQPAAPELGAKFESRGHAKSRDIWMTVRYPQGWRAQEGERPHIVQRFSGTHAGIDVSLMLQMRAATNDIEAECKYMNEREWEAALAGSAAGTVARNGRKIFHETQPGFVLDVERPGPHNGFPGHTYERVMGICYRKTVVMLWCGSGAAGPDAAAKARANMTTLAPLCTRLFNAAVLNEKY